jgi:hypothetical protein
MATRPEKKRKYKESKPISMTALAGWNRGRYIHLHGGGKDLIIFNATETM